MEKINNIAKMERCLDLAVEAEERGNLKTAASCLEMAIRFERYEKEENANYFIAMH